MLKTPVADAAAEKAAVSAELVLMHKRDFFMANRIRNAWEKIEKVSKPVIQGLLDAGALSVPYTFTADDEARAPGVIAAGAGFEAVQGHKTDPMYKRPLAAAKDAGLTPKQLLAITVFDNKLVLAAVEAGVITAAQARAISDEPRVSLFPRVVEIK
jgi:hypothetical protein